MASGLPAEWLTAAAPLRFGPTPTAWGPVEVEVRPEGEQGHRGLDRRLARPLRRRWKVRLAGLAPVVAGEGQTRLALSRGAIGMKDPG